MHLKSTTRSRRWLLTGLSFGSAALLLVGSSTAFAEGDHGRRYEGATDSRGYFNSDNNDDRKQHHNRPHEFNITAFVNALNNQVSLLTASQSQVVDENDDDDDDSDVKTVSLSRATSDLSAADAATVTNAVNSNTAALQTFLTGGSAAATAILADLTAAGISPSSVLAILPMGEDSLIVIVS